MEPTTHKEKRFFFCGKFVPGEFKSHIQLAYFPMNIHKKRMTHNGRTARRMHIIWSNGCHLTWIFSRNSPRNYDILFRFKKNRVKFSGISTTILTENTWSTKQIHTNICMAPKKNLQNKLIWFAFKQWTTFRNVFLNKQENPSTDVNKIQSKCRIWATTQK